MFILKKFVDRWLKQSKMNSFRLMSLEGRQAINNIRALLSQLHPLIS